MPKVKVSVLRLSLWFRQVFKKSLNLSLLKRVAEIIYDWRFVLAKLTKMPLIGKTIHFLMFKPDNLIYLPKDSVIQKSNRVITINKVVSELEEVVLPSEVLNHFIEKANHHWIMNFCICRVSNKCENYPSDLGCLYLGEAVLNIDPRLGRLVTKEEALAHVHRCREADLVHLVGRLKLDAIMLEIGPDHKLLTICNCCECCCLGHLLPHVSPQIQRHVTRMPGVKLTVTDQCIGCGKCLTSCFVNAIQLISKQAVITDACRGCGRCVDICPQKAIVLTIENIGIR
ncbi:MAG: DUF362 domain-containing protein [Candidatus Hermodarchaeota archaeon]